ncbi:MAG: hypothetical protein EON91_06300 [Brevundimonas sp.]|uniref:DUF6249 domain-containing protein n=1 Tax=Brevundimonas sp. TaxID=1871086 RepID=UPI0011FD269B|nr:DUF6249 domain-containing protein [Brevundimonas sp.]RZJ18165.1 MAG: hypothetical protein EON91_06300 [Brevundimonas sp.]
MEDFIPIFAIFAVFGTITAIIVGPTWLKSRERQEMQVTVRAALDKGQPLPPELVDALSQDVIQKLPSRSRDIRRGVIWLAIGIGLAAFGLINDFNGGWDNDFDGLVGIAAIPLTIGLAFLVLGAINKNRD